MATLNINGKRVTVGDEFLSMSPDQQSAEVEAIAGQLGISADSQSEGSGYEAALARASQASQFPDFKPTARQNYNNALEQVRQSQFADMTDEQWRDYSAQVFAPDLGSQADQSTTFGFGDEISAAMGGLGAQVRQMTGGGGGGFGEAYGDLYNLEQARLEYARQQNGALGTGVELVSGLATTGPGKMAQALSQAPRAVQFAANAAPPLIGGAVYGFGSTDGGLQERAAGAGVGLGVAGLGAAVAPVAGKVIQGTARSVAQIPVSLANRATVRQAVKSAPTAAAIKATSNAAYKAAEATGATITPQAMQILAHDVQNLARVQGLIMPSGKLSTAFPKVANVIRATREFAQGGPVSMEQAQTLLRTFRTAQKSTDPDEARLGNLMVQQFEDFIENLPPSGFGKGNGSEAVSQWAKGKTEWSRAKRTQTIENLIADAQMSKGGFASGLRSGFASILRAKNAKARRGFSKADLDAMRAYVDGGNIQAVLEHFGSGAGIPGGLFGGLAGGLPGAVAVPVVGGLARGALNQQARSAAQRLRAQVATPGGIPLRSLPAPTKLTGLGGLGAGVAVRLNGG